MISVILIPFLWMLAATASVVPIDESRSTVNVKQGDHEYSYHIQESHGIAVDPSHPIPLLKTQIPQHIILNSLLAKSSEDIAPEAEIKGHNKDEGLEKQQPKTASHMEEGLQKQSLEQPGYPLLQGHSKEGGLQRSLEHLKIALPGYQLLPSAGNGLMKEEGLEKRHLQEQLKISLPGYRLLPANANIQYIDLPYYYPYVHGYGLQYPYNLPLVRYI